jgi:hypothetical protein
LFYVSAHPNLIEQSVKKLWNSVGDGVGGTKERLWVFGDLIESGFKVQFATINYILFNDSCIQSHRDPIIRRIELVLVKDKIQHVVRYHGL